MTQKLLEKLLRKRTEARKNKDYSSADKIRIEIESLGYSVVDSKNYSYLRKYNDFKSREYVETDLGVMEKENYDLMIEEGFTNPSEWLKIWRKRNS